MDYAAARFAEGGYHPTSVAEIVQGLGVGKVAKVFPELARSLPSPKQSARRAADR